VIDARQKSVRVGISGVAAKPFRATAVERKLAGKNLTAETIAAAAAGAAKGIEPLSDMHGSADYRAHLARVNTARALANAAKRG
jgi:carbon-monoxide dehydrogenase medium subunit